MLGPLFAEFEALQAAGMAQDRMGTGDGLKLVVPNTGFREFTIGFLVVGFMGATPLASALGQLREIPEGLPHTAWMRQKAVGRTVRRGPHGRPTAF